MQRYLLLISCFLSLSVFGQEETQLKDIAFDSVVLYEYNMSRRPFKRIVDQSGNLADRIMKSQMLTKSETRLVVNLLTSNDSYGSRWADCFDPHMGVVFFQSGAIVAHVSICLGCNRLESTFDIPATRHTKIDYADMKVGAFGFSPKARKGWGALCEKFGFRYCRVSLDDPLFDGDN